MILVVACVHNQRNTKLQLEVNENKSVIFIPIHVYKPPDFYSRIPRLRTSTLNLSYLKAYS